MDLSTLSPWEAALYFQTPLTGAVTVAGNGILIVPADPMRVVLIISTTGLISGNLMISIDQSATADGPGINLSTFPSWFQFTQAVHGPLVQQAWYGSYASLAVVCYTSISLMRWPERREHVRNARQSAANAE